MLLVLGSTGFSNPCGGLTNLVCFLFTDLTASSLILDAFWLTSGPFTGIQWFLLLRLCHLSGEPSRWPFHSWSVVNHQHLAGCLLDPYLPGTATAGCLGIWLGSNCCSFSALLGLVVANHPLCHPADVGLVAVTFVPWPPWRVTGSCFVSSDGSSVCSHHRGLGRATCPEAC